MKKLMALTLAAALTLGMSTFAFAAEVTPTEGTGVTEGADVGEGTDVLEGEEVPAEGEEVPVEEGLVPVEEELIPLEEVPAEEVVEEPVVEEVAPVEYTGVEKQYIEPKGEIIGVYPSFTNNKALSDKIFNLLSDEYTNMVTNEFYTYTSDRWDSGNVNGDVFNYNLEETATLAKIEITERNLEAKTVLHEFDVIATYYIDKATNAEVTEEEYLATVVPEEEVPAEGEAPVEGEVPAEEVPAEGEVPVEEVPAEVPGEVSILPLRAEAEALGFVVGWDNGLVTVTQGENVAMLETGVNAYTMFDGTVVELESAPENIDGVLYVPASFFTVVLNPAPVEEVPAEEVPAEEVTEEVPVEGEEVPAEEVTEETPVEGEEVPAEGEEVPAEETPEEVPAA